jgi:hypothetical protein
MRLLPAPTALFVFLAVALSNGPRLRAQEVSGEIVGLWEAQVSPGKSEPLVPLLLPSATGGGRVGTVIDAGRITPQWFGLFPDPVETAVWWPRGGLGAGRTFFGRPVAGSGDWTYAAWFGGAPFAGEAAASVLKAGDSLAVIPLWTLGELVGGADAAGVQTALSSGDADGVSFPGGSVWAAKPDGAAARWVVSTESAPDAGDAGGAVVQDVNRPVVYRRSALAGTPRQLTFIGSARLGSGVFPIEPTPAGATEEIWNPVFRPDGRGFTLASTLGIFGRSAATGLRTGRSVATADRLVIWSPDIQAWESFHYQTARPAGWKSGLGRPVNPAAVKVPPGAPFFVIRPAALPRMELKLPTMSAAVRSDGKLFRQIIDRDRDRLADGWERANGSADLSMLPGADPDGDGLGNLAESLLGGNPRLFDAPGRPSLEVRPGTGGAREVWLTVDTVKGARYRLERRMAGASAWTQLGGTVNGDGAAREVKDPVPLNPAERLPRFYRTVALTPLDSDGDLVSDWEEEFVYHTDPAKRDTDRDGTTDGAELRASGRDPLDYYDGRAVRFVVDPLTDGPVTPPGQWVRQAIAVRALSGNRSLADAPVTFAITRGDGWLSPVAGDESGAGRTLALRTDSSGVARIHVKAGADTGRIEGSVTARVKGTGGLIQLYHGAWTVHVSGNLSVPATGLVRWFRPDQGVTTGGTGGGVTGWLPVTGGPGATAPTETAPRRVTENGWTWIRFSGKEKMELGAVLPDNTFSVCFVAVPTGVRTPAPATVGATGVAAGAQGQCYLLAGPTVPGERVLLHDAPAKPSSRVFSTWEQTDFRYHPGYLAAPSGEEYWRWTRPYDFPVAASRYDITSGFRFSPLPSGIRRGESTGTVAGRFVSGLGRHFANYRTDYEPTTTSETTLFGRVVARERFYRVSATTWRGNSSSPAFGGVPRLDYTKVGNSGFGLSLGAETTGVFELAEFWKPAVCAPAPRSDSGGAMPKSAVLATVRLQNRIPVVETGGVRRAAGTAALSKSPVVQGPRFLGGWEGEANGYQGRIGDLLFYDRDLSDEDRRTIEEVLAAFYRGVSLTDRDRDGLRDWWERSFIGNPSQNARGDLDGDLLNNLEEQTWGTDPAAPDTDGDGLTDRAERVAKTNPLTWDSDGDFLRDGVDPLPLDPRNGRADGNANGKPDGIDALLADTTLLDRDGDGLCDLVEAGWLLTSPILADTDGDTIPDGDEVRAGTDPLVP